MMLDVNGNTSPPAGSSFRRLVHGSASVILSSCIVLTGALLLANILRLYSPGPPMDGLLGVVFLTLGLSLLRHRAPWPRAPLLCFTALAALYGVGVAIESNFEGVRNFVSILYAAIIFLFGFRNAPELARHSGLIVLLVIVATVITIFQWLPTFPTLNPHLISSIYVYILLTIGLILAARGWQGRATLVFLLVIPTAAVFANRSLVFAALGSYAAYWAGKVVLRDRLRVTGLAVCLGFLICLPLLFVLSSAVPLNEEEAFRERTSRHLLQNGRQILWKVAVAHIAAAPWFGHGPGAELSAGMHSPLSPIDGEKGAGSVSCLEQAGAPGLARDCDLLLDIKHLLIGTDGKGEMLWSWNMRSPIAFWRGIELAGTPPRVTALRLPNSGLSGHLPAQLGELDGLQELNLARNQLTGPIPPELGKLPKLRRLALQRNRLTGPIPPELGKLSDLSELWLSNNRLNGAVPTTLTRLDRLSGLRLANNEFVAPFPSPLYAIADHDLTQALFCLPMPQTPPELLADCTALLAMRDIFAGDVPLNWTLSSQIGFWQGVVVAGTPPRVTALRLPNSGLSGHLPAQLGELDGLQELNLAHNQLTGPIPPELGKLPKLRRLALQRNRLTGPIPPELGKLPKLRRLALQRNRLTGPIPPELGKLPKLRRLALQRNRLTGPIPPELGKLSDLSELWLSNNRLNGAVPTTLTRLDRLSGLRLANNEFVAPFPSPLYAIADHDLTQALFCLPMPQTPPELLADCTALLAMRDIFAGDVPLNWTLSSQIGFWQGVVVAGTPPRVTALRLPNSGLSGHLPAQLGELDGLQELNLARNQLTGPIPPELGKLPKLRRLALQRNRLTGPIPPELGKLSDLSELWLSNNRLNGAVPTTLTRLDRLSGLRLANNEFVAPFPSPLYAIADHDLTQALFCLPMPQTPPELLADCTALLAMRDIFAGDVPLNWTLSSQIGFWQGVVVAGTPPRVTALRLPNSGLSGHLPAQLGELDGLQELNLAHNQLTGPIPPELKELRNLVLTGNRLTELTSHPVANHDVSSQFRCSSLPSALVRDCIALLEVRDVLAGGAVLNWDDSTPIQLWQGVVVDKIRQRVVALDLSGKRLRGRLPKELGALDQLQSLHLDHNLLSGAIPPELGRLAHLQELVLDANMLVGPIPVEITQLANLTVLSLRDNGLTAVPSRLEELGKLSRLSLGGNDFYDPLPPALVEINRDVGDDLLCSMIARQDTFRGLRQDCRALLDARDILTGSGELNWNDTLPIGLWRGVRLAHASEPRVVALRLPGSGLTGEIPPQLGHLTRLVSLRLNGNHLTGTIPAKLSSLRELVELRLENNRLSMSSPILDLNLLNNSLLVSLGGNRLDAVKASSASRDLALVTATASDGSKHVAQPVPDIIGKELFCRPSASPTELLADCEALLAARTALIGKGAAPLVNWSDSIPIGFWRGVTLSAETPPRVVALDLSQMRLHGRIPPELGVLERLHSLRLHRNRLAGPIPAELEALDNLQELMLGMNALTGSIPPTLGKLYQLKVLHLRRNRLTGSIPEELGELKNLQTLVLDGNALTGSVPVTLASLPNLEELWLKGNRLSGEIPAELAEPGRLAVLDLGDDVSSVGYDAGGLRFCEAARGKDNGLGQDCTVLLDVRERLMGTARLNWDITTPINDWQGVEVSGVPARVTALNLARTGINGNIPPELHKLDRLIELRLSDNGLTGPIPPELGKLVHLQVLALNNNALTGWLPRDLAKIPGLREVRLGGNATEHKRLCQPSLLDSPGLLDDCTVLLAVRDRLRGDAFLNWNKSTPIEAWKGVTVGDGGPERVVAVELPRAGLNGRLPSELLALKRLVSLRLEDNRLTGFIPAGLDHLRDLVRLRLDGNDFSGCVPSAPARMQGRDLELDMLCGPSAWAKPKLYDDMAVLISVQDALAGNAELNWDFTRPVTSWQGVTVGGEPPRVEQIMLSRMGLDGHIPPQLEALDRLVALHLDGNRLTGTVPLELGNLEHLRLLWINHNQLSGSLPSELERFAGLTSIRLHENNFTGCVSHPLHGLRRELAASSGLPECVVAESDTQGFNLKRTLIEGAHQWSLWRPAITTSKTAHNLVLQVGLQTGIIGIAVLLLLFVSLIFGLVAPQGEGIGPTRRFALACIVTIILHNAFEVFLLQNALVLMTITWLLIGLSTGVVHAGETCKGSQ